MIVKNKYCSDCKGYGDIYCQFITRYGDKRIKEKSLYHLHECKNCKGTGMIIEESDKVTLFKPEELEPIDVENEESEESEVENSEDLEPKKMQVENKDTVISNEDLEFEPKYNEPPEGAPKNFFSNFHPKD